MRLSLVAAGLLAFTVTIAQYTPDDSVAGDSDEDPFFRCGNSDPSDLTKRVAKDMVKEAAVTDGRTIQVDTYVHIVESKAREGYVTQKMVNDQVSRWTYAYSSLLYVSTRYILNISILYAICQILRNTPIFNFEWYG